MMVSVVVDANCIAQFQFERMHDQHGNATQAIEHIFAAGHIALDLRGACQQEWVATASGSCHLNLLDWVTEQLADGRIKYYELAKMRELQKDLLDLGLPKPDAKWFLLAVQSNSKALVSEDIDFYHPPAKTWSHKKKEEYKEGYKGCICGFIRKNLNFQLVRLAHVPGMV